jgi:hypothetical protein
MASAKKASSKPGIPRSRRKRNEAKSMNRCVFIGTLLLILLTMAIAAKAEGHLFRIGDPGQQGFANPKDRRFERKNSCL